MSIHADHALDLGGFALGVGERKHASRLLPTRCMNAGLDVTRDQSIEINQKMLDGIALVGPLAPSVTAWVIEHHTGELGDAGGDGSTNSRIVRTGPWIKNTLGVPYPSRWMWVLGPGVYLSHEEKPPTYRPGRSVHQVKIMAPLQDRRVQCGICDVGRVESAAHRAGTR